MYYILHGIKRIIERFIVNMTPLSAAVSAGATVIPLQRTRRFQVGDVVVIYNRPVDANQPEGEVHTVLQVCEDSLVIDMPLVGSYSLSNSYVEKMIGYEHGNEVWLDSVYIGDPEVILKYPAITINGRSRSSEWLTMESTKETYEIDITVYVEAADYESQIELMLSYVKQIEDSLFRSLYPLVEPYVISYLVASASPGDTQIQVDNDTLISCKGSCWVFLENDTSLKPNYLTRHLGSGVYTLQFPICAEFAVGDKLIQPWRHIFNSLPKSTQYGTVNKGTMLKAAVISWTCSEEVWRHVAYRDPLTF